MAERVVDIDEAAGPIPALPINMDIRIKPEPDFTISLNIVYEDDDIVVLNKQAGISIHPALQLKGGVNSSINKQSGTIVNALLARYPEIKNVGDDSFRPGIVHRLDKDTSGILVVAKNQKTFEFLKKEWQSGNVVKKYLALVWNCPKNEKGKIVSELARSVKDFRKRMVLKPRHFPEKSGTKQEKNDIKGKLAITEYKVVKKYKDYSLVEVYPKTGRMHQIRVQMASIGHPVAGDKVYGGKRKSPEGLFRQFLHAYYLKFSLPNSKSLVLEADLPQDLERVLTPLENAAL